MTSPNVNSSPLEFYRAALADSFRHSGLLSEATGRRAEQIVDTAEFGQIVAATIPMSLEAARRIGDLAVVHLSAAAAPGPWWRELLAYERAHFLQAASADQRLVTYFPRRGVAATTVNFTWDMPLVLKHIESLPHHLRSAAEQGAGTEHLRHRSQTLLFSRTPDARICVVELEKPVAAVFRMTNGMRKKEQIADAAGLSLAHTEEILRALAQIGAVENI